MSGFVQQVKAMGEEKVGQLAAKLLSNPKFVQGIQVIVSNGLEAKEALDKNLQLVVGALGLPTAAEQHETVERIEALERDLEELRDRLEALTSDLEAQQAASKPAKKATKKAAPKS